MGKAAARKRQERVESEIAAEREKVVALGKELDQDALDLLTDDHLRAALTQRREDLKQRLAQFVVDEMMDDFEPNAQWIEARRIIAAGIRRCDERLNGASELLRGIEDKAKGET